MSKNNEWLNDAAHVEQCNSTLDVAKIRQEGYK